jgi:glycosyltransferase involved in cell wall biosynthesis
VSGSVNDAMLIVLPWSPELPGGVSVVVRNIARTWRAESLPTTILVSDWSHKLADVDAAGVIRMRLASIAGVSLVRVARSALTAPSTLMRTLTFLRARKIDAVSFHYASLDCFGVAMLKRLKLYRGRLVLCFHGTDVRPPTSRIESALWAFVLSSADSVTACSNSLARSVEKNFGLRERRVTTVYNGVDTLVFSPSVTPDPARGEYFDQKCTKYIVSVGSFIERKGHMSLLHAFARVATALTDVGLVIVGMDGDQRVPLEVAAKSLGIEGRVRFLVDLRPAQVAAVVIGATVCVQPSIAEPFGMAVIEAGAVGVCVVASDVGGHSELIEHQRTGFLFQAGDVQELASTLAAVICDDTLRKAAAALFLEQVVERYSWEACAVAYKAASMPRSP